MKWIAIENKGQLPVCRLYTTHQWTVLRPSMYISFSVPRRCERTPAPRFNVSKLPSVRLFSALVSDSESSFTKSTSQSKQWVNPGRYSALHFGQNMTADDTTPKETPRGCAPSIGFVATSDEKRWQGGKPNPPCNRTQQPRLWGGSSEHILLHHVGCEARRTPASGDALFLDLSL